MRQPWLAVRPLYRRRLCALALLVGAAAVSPAQAHDYLTVRMDKAKLIKFPVETDTIVVGNPIVADVTMLKSSGILVVTGKGYGETNLILLDRHGTILNNATLRVEPADGMLTVQRGPGRETYACAPRCEPVVNVGDDPTYMKDVITSIANRNSAALPTSAAAH